MITGPIFRRLKHRNCGPGCYICFLAYQPLKLQILGSILLMVPYPMFQARQIYRSKDRTTLLRGERNLEEVWESHGQAVPLSLVSLLPSHHTVGKRAHQPATSRGPLRKGAGKGRTPESMDLCRPPALQHAGPHRQPPHLAAFLLPFTHEARTRDAAGRGPGE